MNAFPPIRSDLTIPDLTPYQCKKMIIWQVLRIILTPSLLISLYVLIHTKNEKFAVLTLVIVLLLLDFVDGNPIIRKWGGVNFYSGAYHYTDKLLDQAQYAAALALVSSANWRWPGDPTLARAKCITLILSWAWRMIGVGQLMRTGRLDVLTWFPDVFKELLILWCIIPNAGIVEVCIVIVGKMVFEWLKAKGTIDILKLDIFKPNR